jgi:pSer/pThr/pTyr-binding forkhead associated (FHA) protein
LSGDQRDYTLSRHHCELHINSCVRLQDLGSLNGTFRNGQKLEPAEVNVPEDAASLMRKLSVAAEVQDGDVITVGETSFQVNMVDCPLVETRMTGDSSCVWPAGAVAKEDCPMQC